MKLRIALIVGLMTAICLADGPTSKPTDANVLDSFPALRKRLAELTELVARLKSENEALRIEVAELKKKVPEAGTIRVNPASTFVSRGAAASKSDFAIDAKRCKEIDDTIQKALNSGQVSESQAKELFEGSIPIGAPIDAVKAMSYWTLKSKSDFQTIYLVQIVTPGIAASDIPVQAVSVVTESGRVVSVAFR